MIRPALAALLAAASLAAAEPDRLAVLAQRVAADAAASLVAVRSSLDQAAGARAQHMQRWALGAREGTGLVVAGGWVVARSELARNPFGGARLRVNGQDGAPAVQVRIEVVLGDGTALPGETVHIDDELGLAVFRPVEPDARLAAWTGAPAPAPRRLDPALALARARIAGDARPLLTWRTEVAATLPDAAWLPAPGGIDGGVVLLAEDGGILGIAGGPATGEGGPRLLSETPRVRVAPWQAIAAMLERARTAPVREPAAKPDPDPAPARPKPAAPAEAAPGASGF